MTVIDVGAAAIDRTTTVANATTLIDLNNPANASGIITSVELWYNTNATGVKVGTFYGSSTDYTCRDFSSIGDVTSGSKQTFPGLSIQVQVGDFIGFYHATGAIENDTTGGAGNYYLAGDHFSDGLQTYTLAANYISSCYGTGLTVGGFFTFF